MALKVSHGLKILTFDHITSKLCQIGSFQPFSEFFKVDDVIITKLLLKNDVINENE